MELNETDRHLILSVQQADNHLLLIDEFAKARQQEAIEANNPDLAKVYENIIEASKTAKIALYGVRDDFRTVLRATGLGFSGLERDH